MIELLETRMLLTATVVDPTVNQQADSISLTPGAETYLYGFSTGGERASSPFSNGSTQTLDDEAGILADGLAVTTQSSNTFPTSTQYQAISGVGVSGYTNMQALYGTYVVSGPGEENSGSYEASVNFTLTQSALVVAMGLGSSQQTISFQGPAGLVTDKAANGGVAAGIAHLDLAPGTYTITETTSVTAAGQTLDYMADLLGVYIFTGGTLAAPTGVAATQGQYSDHVVVDWTGSLGAQSYELFRNTSDTNMDLTPWVSGLTSTNYDDNSVSLGATYYYWVKAVEGNEVSSFSNGASGYVNQGSGSGTSAGGVNLSPLQINDESGTFTYSGDEYEASGTIQIGLAPPSDSAFQPLLTVDGNVSYDDSTITVNGSVSVSIGDLTLPVFNGSFVIPVGQDESSSATDEDPSENEGIAGLPIDVTGLTLTVGSGGPEVELEAEIQMPEPLSISAEAEVVITPDGISLGSGSVSFPSESFSVGFLNISAQEMSISYNSTSQELVLQGDLTLDDLIGDTSAEADFAGAGNGIFISNTGVNATGDLSLDNLEIDGWGLDNASLDVNTAADSYNGSATLAIPDLASVGASFSLIRGQLNSLSLSLSNINPPIPILDTGWFLTGIGGGVSNLVNGPITFSGSLDLSLGPDEQIQLPSWLGGQDASTALATLDMNTSINSTDIEGDATLTIADGLATFTGNANLNLASDSFSANGSLTAFDNVLTGSADINISSTGAATVYAEGTLSIPSSDIPIIGTFLDENITIANGNFYLNYNPAIGSEDYVDLWGTTGLTSLSVPLIQFPEGVQVVFSSSPSVDLLYANNLPSVPADSLGAPQTGVSAPATQSSNASMTFTVASGTPWVLLEAGWSNSSSNVPVEVVAANGTTYSESQFSSAIGIGLIDQMSGSTNETVGISDPAAGQWTLILPNTTGLGPVTFDAVGATPIRGDHLVVVQQAANAAAGDLLSPIVVAVEDQNGNVITTDNSTVTLSPTSDSQNVSGTLTATAVNGLATFNSLEIDATGAYAFNLMDGSDTGATSSVTIGNPAGLAPGAGAQYSITGATGAQTVEILSGTVTLSGDLSSDFSNYTLKIDSGAQVFLTSSQHVGQLSLGGNAVLDVGVYSMIINYETGPDPKATILAALASGCNGGSWNGTGIVSSAATPSDGKYGVGFADGADDVAPGLASGQIELKYTLNGDANLDGTVNGADFSIIASNFGRSAPNGWEQGDFSYSGVVNGSDFAELAANFGEGANQVTGATQLKFSEQPASNTAGSALGTVTVDVEDQFGDVVTSDNSIVSLLVNNGAGTLQGTVTVQAQNGVATFNSLSIVGGGGYTLSASDGNLADGVSNPFTIYDTDVWMGAVSSDWSNPNNWNTGIVPGSGTNVVINSGTVVAAVPIHVAQLGLNGCILQLADGAGTSTVSALTINNAATLDIGNNELIINYGSGGDPISATAGYIKTGFNNGGWNGWGIISSAAQTPINGYNYGVGWADGQDGVVAGLSSGQIEIKYTLLGDANLDGVVNGSDFSIVASHFGQGVTNWDEGNFLFTSAVNGSDFSALAANFGQGDSGAASASTTASFAAAAPTANIPTADPAAQTKDPGKDSKFLAKR